MRWSRCAAAVACLSLAVSLGGCSKGPTELEYVQLQERCAAAAKAAFEEFQRDLGEPPANRWGNYSSHYSLKKRKCYANMWEMRSSATGSATNRQLQDVFGHATVGRATSGSHGQTCRLEGRLCEGVQQFVQLVKPYMED